MTRVLVTGGTGFVGANLCRRLLAEGHAVHLLVRAEHDSWRITEIRGDVTLHEVSLGDPDRLTEGLRQIRPDTVFHLAVHGGYPTQVDARQMIETNLVGTLNLLEACLRADVATVVNTGSSSEYGLKDHAPAENEPVDPDSCYAVTKVSATLLCQFMARKHGLHVPTLRLYSVYGPYEEPSRLMPTLIVHGFHGRLPPLVAPEVARDFVAVNDVCDAYLRAAVCRASEPGPIYNVGSGSQTTVREVVALARARLPITDAPVWGSLPNRQWDTSTWVANTQKIRTELEWSPRISLTSGFEQMIAWLRDDPARRAIYERSILAPRGAADGSG